MRTLVGLCNPGGEFDVEELDRRMNKLGRQGWELVGGFDTNFTQDATRNLVLLFKRPRVDTVLPAEE